MEKSLSDDIAKGSDFEEQPLRLVLIGKMGVGKSATANTICGEDVFQSKHSASSVTTTSKTHSTSINGRTLLVIDTPGICNADTDDEDVKSEIRTCVDLSIPGLHAILFVISMATRFTQEDKKTFEKFINLFGEQIYKFSIVLFTNADVFDDTADQYVQNSPTSLKDFISKCGSRYTSFNNRADKKLKWLQVKTLLLSIDSMRSQNIEKYYTNKQFKEAEDRAKAREVQLMKDEKERYAKKKAEIRAKMQIEIKQETKRLMAKEDDSKTHDIIEPTPRDPTNPDRKEKKDCTIL